MNERIAYTFVKGFFVSTVDTFDNGLETMVFPASENARVVHNFFYPFNAQIVGVDFAKALEEYTRHYATKKEAAEGHREVVKLVRKRGKQ